MGQLVRLSRLAIWFVLVSCLRCVISVVWLSLVGVSLTIETFRLPSSSLIWNVGGRVVSGGVMATLLCMCVVLIVSLVVAAV